MGMAIWVRQGLWGLLTSKVPVHFFPVGYYVHNQPGVGERRGLSRLVLGRAVQPRGHAPEGAPEGTGKPSNEAATAPRPSTTGAGGANKEEP